MTDPRVLKRFWSKVSKSIEEDGCWIWIGARHERGYGRFRYDKRIRGAHRVSWELETEDRVPDSMMVLHYCDHPECVRPSHLYLGTALDNARDRAERGSSFSRIPKSIRHAEQMLERIQTQLASIANREEYLKSWIKNTTWSIAGIKKRGNTG